MPSIGITRSSNLGVYAFHPSTNQSDVNQGSRVFSCLHHGRINNRDSVTPRIKTSEPCITQRRALCRVRSDLKSDKWDYLSTPVLVVPNASLITYECQAGIPERGKGVLGSDRHNIVEGLCECVQGHNLDCVIGMMGKARAC